MFRVISFWALSLAFCLSLADAVDYESQSITIALTQEPPNLNSLMSTDTVSYFVLGHTIEGLARYDRRGRLVPGVAESWDVEATRIVFHLRVDAVWSNGTPVTAHDFVHAWRLVSNPDTAAPFAAIMHPVRNAEKVQRGELPVEQLGVVALDDLTLEMQLERACGYCVSLMTHGTFFPINQAFYERVGERYGADAETLLSNGPFQLTAWKHGVSMELKRRPEYWQADKVALNNISVGYITEDNRTRLNLFRDGEIALVRLGAETVKDAADQGLRVRTFLSGGVAYLWFNMREGRLTRDKRVRQAVQKVFDSEEYVNKVIGIPGYRATTTLFPGWLQGAADKFVVEHPPRAQTTDVNAARALITEVRKERPTEALTLLTVASPTGAKVAEYLQGKIANNLGIPVKVDQQTFKQYLDKARRGQFDLVLSSWYPDFDDIVTYADLLVSWNPNNRGQYVSDEYDRWFRVLQASAVPRERMSAAAQLQDLITEDVPVLPMAETGSAYIQHPKLRGVVRRVMGQDPDYTFAEVIR